MNFSNWTLPPWIADATRAWLPVLLAILVGVSVLYLTQRTLQRRGTSLGITDLFSQLLMLVVTGVVVIAIVLTLPISDVSRGELLSLMGLLITAAIALASTTFIGNVMAGLMLRAIRNFRPGDFIRVGEHFGRVSEQGLLHTEIQTEDRDLTTIPNTHLVTHPVRVVRSSGTVLSATLSLGYDVSRHDVEKHLLEAAQRAELKDPFVQILDLGDFSITYRVAGILEDVKVLFTARSHLRGCMLDAFHDAGIEIVSPTFVNQRRIHDDLVVPQESSPPLQPPTEAPPEAMIFDKAEEAAEAQHAADLEKCQARIASLTEDLVDVAEEERENLEEKLRKEEQRQADLATLVSTSIDSLDGKLR